MIDDKEVPIVFGSRTFSCSNNKPLVTILDPQTAVSTLSVLRMQRWTLILQAYQYDIEYGKSEQHANADMLSRLHDPHKTAGEEPSIYNVSCVNDIPVSAINIATETVMEGWPNHVSDELKLYFMKRNELSMVQGCLLWGYRVVIPPKFQHVLLKELNNEHSGISQTKSFARSYMWWPNMNVSI